MPRPLRPKQALVAWKKSPVGATSSNYSTLASAAHLRARIDLAFMAGFDSGVKAEHKKGLRKAKKPKG